jgi:protein-S-isoprenylcysteine O-methyltransferase Ste14
MPTLPANGGDATALLQVTVVGFAVSEVRIRLRSARNSGGDRVDRGSIVAVVLGIGAGALTAVWCAVRVSSTSIPGGWRVVVVGVVLMWLGIALRQWALLALGAYFTVLVQVRSRQKVVDAGPYRWVRHPSYTGLLLTLVGLGVALSNWLSLIALAVLPTAGVVVRIRVEEAALLSALRSPYREYAERRRRLVPGLW